MGGHFAEPLDPAKRLVCDNDAVNARRRLAYVPYPKNITASVRDLLGADRKLLVKILIMRVRLLILTVVSRFGSPVTAPHTSPSTYFWNFDEGSEEGTTVRPIT